MINYTFPVINNVDDIKEVLKKTEFKVSQKDGYQVVNYAGSTFETPLEAECRGLIFAPDGTILARRFHKFFNAGERADILLQDVANKMATMDYVIMEKLDGSMISPIPRVDIRSSNEVQFRLGTKMGITDVALQAEAWLVGKKNYVEFINYCLSVGLTPIFEWCSSQQRIVLEYAEDNLILTAMRYNVHGTYFTYEEMERYARTFNIPLVKTLDKSLTIDQVKNLTDSEGIVIRFDDGHMVKVKSDWYCKIHKVKDDVCSESKVLDLIINEKIDDVLPILMDEDKARVEAYRRSVSNSVKKFSVALTEEYHKILDTIGRRPLALVSKKDFALFIQDHRFKGLLFKFFDKPEDRLTIVMDYVKRHIKKPQEIRDIIGPPYKEMNINE